MSLRGPTADTLAGDLVEIQLNPDPSYGVSFSADSDGCAAIVISFDLLPNGKFGMIQKHGGVHAGDVLFEINDINLSNMKHEEVVRLIKDRNMLKKVLKFMNSREYYRRKYAPPLSYDCLHSHLILCLVLFFRRGGSIRGGNPADGKNNFLSTIKRTRISEERGRKHVEYEIACQFRLASAKVATEVVYQWSTWKRYSEFESLHSSLRSSLGWQMEGIELPSPYTFVFNKLTPEFIAQRRGELVEYWSKVIAIDKSTDFQKHHCSQDLKSFLEVEMQTQKEVATTPDALVESPSDNNGESENNNTNKNNHYGGGGAPANRRASANRANSRRLSAKSVSINNGGSFPEISAPSNNAKTAPTATNSSSSSSAAAVASPPSQPAPPAAKPAPPAAAAVPPVAPTRPAAPSPAVVAAPEPPSGSNLPPKPIGARANLLGAIAARRID